MATEKLITQIIVKGDKKANKQVDTLDKSMGGLAKKFAVAGIAAVAVTKSFKFMGESAKLLREDNKEFAKLTAIIKTTGGAAGLTATQMANYANEIQNATGVSNTLLLKSQGMLATFKNISGPVFNRATQAIVDMSAVQGELTGNTLQLGKALNDPTVGLTALSRVGVAFTDEQKNLIKSLQESGDMLGAQNIILKELEGQFKGSAEAMAQNTDLLSASFGDFRKRLAKDVEPAIQGVSGVLNDLISIPVEEQIKREADGFKTLIGILQDTTTSEAMRAVAIKGLQEQYPDYIKNIDLEKGSTEDLNTAVKKYNELTDERLKRAVFEEENKAFIKSIGNLEQKIISATVSYKKYERGVNEGKLEGNNLILYAGNIERLKEELVEAREAQKSFFAETPDEVKFPKLDGGSEDLIIQPKKLIFKPLAIEYDYELDDTILDDNIIEVITHVDVTQLEALPTALDMVKSKASELSEAFSSVFGSLGGALSAYSDMWNAEMDNELAALKHTNKYAEANSDERAIMEQKVTDKYKDEKKKQWAIEKAFNVSKAIIDTTSAVIEALPNYVLAAAVGIFGAAQTAFIAGTPPPAFAMGGDFLTNGPQMIMVGDNPGGRERVSITPTSSTNYNGPQGSDTNIEKAISDGIARGLSAQPSYIITTIDDVKLNKRNEAGGLRRRVRN